VHQYGVSEVERLLQLPRSTIRSLVRSGFVTPARGPRNAWLFSFQDLVVLRQARALVAAKVPSRSIARAMRELRRRNESGQYALALDGEPKGALKALGLRSASTDWFGKALALEPEDPEAAIEAYERAIEAQPALPGAYVNLGRLLYETGRLASAERVYREGLRASGGAPLLHYNLGVLLDGGGRRNEALRAYQAALRGDPALADCHYNVALLCEELGRPREAIRHLAQYRKLTRRPK
jgi:tetratricopeptide (TPR) repeat protein